MSIKRIKYIAILLAGIALVILGGFFIQERWTGALIGLGAGLCGMAGAQLVTQHLLDRDPDFKKKLSIEESDERNIRINNYAKGKAFDFLQFLALPFFLTLILADVRLWVVLLAIAVYLAYWGVYLWFLTKQMKNG